jgi:ABC-2 type transport system permease protein
MIFDQGLEDRLGDEVQSGDVALALVRPMPLESYLFSWFVGQGLARVVYYVLPAGLLLAALFGDQIRIEPARFLWFLPYALVAFRLAFELQYFLGILAFFLIVNKQASWSLDMLVRIASGLIVPLHLFPAAVAAGLELLPFQYLYYRPIQALLEPAAPAALLAGLAVGAAWLVALRLANRQLLAAALRRHLVLGG